jgi:hypothetical protein
MMQPVSRLRAHGWPLKSSSASLASAERFGQQCFLVERVVTEHAGPAQHFADNGERPVHLACRSHLPIERTELSQQVLIELQLLRAAGCRHEKTRHSTLPRPALNDGLAQCGFRHAQLVANAETGRQESGN